MHLFCFHLLDVAVSEMVSFTDDVDEQLILPSTSQEIYQCHRHPWLQIVETMEAVESNGRLGDTDRRTLKKDRRIFWACVFIHGNKHTPQLLIFQGSIVATLWLDPLASGSACAVMVA